MHIRKTLCQLCSSYNSQMHWQRLLCKCCNSDSLSSETFPSLWSKQLHNHFHLKAFFFVSLRKTEITENRSVYARSGVPFPERITLPVKIRPHDRSHSRNGGKGGTHNRERGQRSLTRTFVFSFHWSSSFSAAWASWLQLWQRLRVTPLGLKDLLSVVGAGE